MHVFEVAWLTEEQISHFRSDFKVVANFFVQKRKNKDHIPDDPTEIRHVDEVLKLLQVMTGDRRYEEIFRKKKEGVHSIVVPGGETGQLSIYNGLIAAKEISNVERSIVLIHDGVRPLINEKLIKNNIETVKKYGSAITTAKVKETILVVNEGKATIDYVPSRNNSRVAKAPQSFWLDDILTVHEKSLADGEKNCIDSCTMMQKYGYDLYLIDGPSQNIKITTPEDFYTMRAILEAKENEQIYGIED